MATPASVTRVAVVQLAYHPAVIVDRRSPLEDPLYEPDRRDSLLPERGDVPDALRERLEALRRRVREAYGRQLLARAGAALERCRAWGARLVVFPRQSVPWELLGGFADAAGDMVLVAGSHTVDRAARRSGVYERLVAAEAPAVGQEVFPVIHRGRLLALVPGAGGAWAPVDLPDGIPGPMGVVGAPELAEGRRGIEACRFLVIPGAGPGLGAEGAPCGARSGAPNVPMSVAPDAAARAWEEARRLGRPALYCDEAAAGGTSVFADEASAYDLRRFPERAGHLEAGDEGVIVADVDLGHERGRRGARGAPAVAPVAEATLVYRARPVADAYARWLAEGAALLERDDDEALEALARRVTAARALLLDVGALSGGAARGRRLKRLLADVDRILGVEEVRRFTREVVLPAGVLPLEALRAALARGAADSVFEWLKELRGAGIDEVEARLRRAGQSIARTGAGTWTLEGMAAVDAVAEEVRERAPAASGAPRGPASVPPRQPALRAVLPSGVDPAALGALRARGFEMVFRARPAELAAPGRARLDRAEARMWSETASAPASSPESAAAPQTPTRAPPPPSELGRDPASAGRAQDLAAAEDLFALAIAEGADRVATVRVSSDREGGRPPATIAPPPGGEIFVVAPRRDAARPGYVLWTASAQPWIERSRAALSAALAEAGLERAEIVSAARAPTEARIAALARRFEGAAGAVAGALQRRLRDVEGCFVEPAARVDGGEPRPALAALDAWLASGAEAARLLGEFGAGKSTTLAAWADGLWQARRARPILASLSAASGAEDPERLLLDAAGVEDTPAGRAALRLCVQRRLVLPCFDGFDDLATRVGLRDLPAWLSRLIGVAAGGGQVVITCRDGYFPAARALRTETERALAQALGAAASVARVVLQPFDEARVRELIERCRPGSSEQALARIGRAYGLRDLVGRPLLLAMALATLDRIEPGAAIAAADLYEAYLRRWLDETRSAHAERLADAQKEDFLESLADHLWRTGSPSCTFEELGRSVRARLSQALPAAPAGAAALDLQDTAFIVRADHDRAAAHAAEGAPRGARPGAPSDNQREPQAGEAPRFRFTHRSFLEYFLARGLVRTLRERPRDALGTRPLTGEVIAFVGEILRRHGDPADAEAVRAVQAWLAAGRGGGGEALELTADAAGNALRLLLKLRRWAKQEGAWVPAGADLRGVRMAGADLQGARLVRARLEGVDLSGADLTGADLREAALDGAALTGAVLDGAILARASARGADFTQVGADGASLEGASLAGAALRQSTWTGCRWEGVDAADADVTAWVAPGPGALGERYAVSVRAPLSFASVAGGHWGPARAVAWSPDGARLASAGEDGTVRIWNVVSGVELARIEGHRAPVTAVAWSPDGAWLASASEDRTARIWDASSGGEAKRFERHRGRVNAVAWSPDGARVATAGDDGAARIWDAATGTEQRCLTGHGRPVAGVVWSPRGDRLATVGADGALRLWDSAWGQELRRVDIEDARAGAVAWSAGGERIAIAASRGGVRLWDAAMGEPAGHLPAGTLGGIAWSPDGERLAGAERDGAVWIWDLAHGGEAAALDAVRRRMSAVAWSPEGARLATAELDGTLRVWDVATGGELRHLDRHLGVLSAVAWSPARAEIASGSEDGTLRIWDARAGVERLRVDAHRRRISALAWGGRDRLATAGLDGAVRTWDLAVPQGAPAVELGRADVPQGAACAIAWSAEGLRVASAGLDGIVRIADGATGAELARLEGHAAAVTVVAWSHDVGLVASAGRDGSVRIWSAAAVRLLHSLQGHPADSGVVSPASNRSSLYTLQAHTSDVNALAWSPRGDRLASAAHSDGVRLWDTATGAQIARLTGHRAWVRALAWSPAGDRLATAGDDGTVRLWDAATGAEVACLEQRHRIRGVAWSPDGARLATADRDGAIGVWDAARGALLCTLEAVDRSTLARTPGGFCRFGGGAPERFRLTLRRPSRGPHAELHTTAQPTELYLPLAGLRRALHAPDKVTAALAGDLDGDDLRRELERTGYDNGVPWDGSVRRVTQPRRAATGTAGEAAPEHGDEVRQVFNPFQPGYPLTVTLPGREQVVGEILSLIQAHRPTVLRGPRRAGKTSILIHLEKRFAASRIRRVSLQGSRIKTPDDLARVLEPSLADHRSPAKTLRKRLERRDRQSRLVLLIDEVVYLVGADPSVFAWLRAIGQEGEASLVFAGSHCDWISVVRHAGSQPGSSFGNDMMVLSLGPIREDDAIRFLIDTTPADVGPVERAAHWIVELCGPWPFYLQVMGYELVKAVRAGDRRPLVERHSVLDLYERKLLFDWFAVFHDRWNELPPRVQRILRNLHRLPRGEMPGYADLSLDEQGALGEAGLCVPPGIWLKDPPFFDWIRRRGDAGKDGEDEHV